MRCVCLTIVAVEKQQVLNIMSVCGLEAICFECGNEFLMSIKCGELLQ